MSKKVLMSLLICVVMLSVGGIASASPGKTANVEFYEQPMPEFLNKMMAIYGWNGYVVNGSTGIGDLLVSIKVNNETSDQVMDKIARTHNFSWVMDNNVVLITPKGMVFDFKTFHVNDTKKAKELVSSVINPKRFVVDETACTIFAVGDHADLSLIEQLLKDI